MISIKCQTDICSDIYIKFEMMKYADKQTNFNCKQKFAIKNSDRKYAQTKNKNN